MENFAFAFTIAQCEQALIDVLAIQMILPWHKIIIDPLSITYVINIATWYKHQVDSNPECGDTDRGVLRLDSLDEPFSALLSVRLPAEWKLPRLPYDVAIEFGINHGCADGWCAGGAICVVRIVCSP